jgi:hypothetical protein
VQLDVLEVLLVVARLLQIVDCTECSCVGLTESLFWLAWRSSACWAVCNTLTEMVSSACAKGLQLPVGNWRLCSDLLLKHSELCMQEVEAEKWYIAGRANRQ